MLQRMGFAVELAVDGVDATERFERESGRYGCVLLDLVMPRMDGIETMSELRRICPDVRVVLSSGYSEDEIRERFAERGFAGFIQKPYRYAQLERVLGHAMRG